MGGRAVGREKYHPERAAAGADIPRPPPAVKPAPAAAAAADPTADRSTIAPAAIGKPGISRAWLDKGPERRAWVGPEPYNVQVFFGVYFVMTGLHGIHVIAGMAVIAWVLLRAARGEFSPAYFTPVDFTGLYWHLVQPDLDLPVPLVVPDYLAGTLRVPSISQRHTECA